MNLLRPEFRAVAVVDTIEVHGLAACGPARDALLLRLLADDDDRLAALSGVASSSVAIVVGPGELLPWIDGAVYLRRRPEEPRLLLPTTTCCSVPATALLAALLRRGELRPPVAVLPDRHTIVSLADALPPDRRVLQRLLAGGAT